MLARASTAIVLLVVILYGLYEAWPLISGPELVIASPINGESFDNGYINISGTAVHTQNVILDGSPILTDPDGHFGTVLTLPHGSAILTLIATDRFGRSVAEQRTIFVP